MAGGYRCAVALPGMDEIRADIESELVDFVAERAKELNELDPHLEPVARAISDYILAGGKRFRPIFAYLGYLGVGGAPDRAVLRACSSLELVHACALIHDDLMDGSDSRRNQPAIHKRFEKLHSELSYSGSPINFGAAAAILLGDLALAWSDWFLAQSGLEGAVLARSIPIFHEMRAELMAGQYLDLLEGAMATSNRSRSLQVANLKSGKYSIERPLRFGAAIAGAPESSHLTYSRFGMPLGQAFQLRDDLLGVFGDPSVTGKPAGDDLREGKRTVLIAVTIERLPAADQVLLNGSLGNPNLSAAQIGELQAMITECGARAECESIAEELLAKALAALDESDLQPEIASRLQELAVMAVRRSS